MTLSQQAPSLVERLLSDNFEQGDPKAIYRTRPVALFEEAAARITELEEERRTVIENIPMSYLKARDVAGATGPSASLDLVGAIRDYAAARWRIIDRCKDAESRAERAEAQCRVLREALTFYADPETYHAVMVFCDPPSGAFIDDFSEDHGHPEYDRSMPGKLARQALSLSGGGGREEKGSLPESPSADAGPYPRSPDEQRSDGGRG